MLEALGDTNHLSRWCGFFGGHFTSRRARLVDLHLTDPIGSELFQGQVYVASPRIPRSIRQAFDFNGCPTPSYQVAVSVTLCEEGCLSDINNNGVCDDEEVPGCTYAFAENFNPEATDDDGSCTVAECEPALQDVCLAGDLDGDGVVGSLTLIEFLTLYGSEFLDSDGDGLCDELDDCFGVYDECGVCAGPGSIYVCGCEECSGFQSCGDPVTYQGYDYATVLIGEQCWFAETFGSGNYENGDMIWSNLSDSDWENATMGAVAVYGEGSSACDNVSPDGDACDESWSLNEYGRIYNWYAVDDTRGLCPSGWHVPTDGEWTVMTDGLGGESVAGGQMKTEYGWNVNNGTNSSGFSGLPGGFRLNLGFFVSAGFFGGYWSSSPNGSNASFRYLEDDSELVISSNSNLRNGFSVRCVRDNE